MVLVHYLEMKYSRTEIEIISQITLKIYTDQSGGQFSLKRSIFIDYSEKV